nr:transposase [Acidiphilium sp. 34-64-41]
MRKNRADEGFVGGVFCLWASGRWPRQPVAAWRRSHRLPAADCHRERRPVERYGWVAAASPTNARLNSRLASCTWVSSSGRALLLEIRDLGYTGSLSHLGRLLAGWHRAGRPVTVDAATTATPNLIDPLTGHLVSPIVAAALCVKPRGLLTEAQAAKVDAFKTISPAFATLRALAMRFRGILRGGDVETLTVWLHDAHFTTLYGIRRFVHTLRQDLAAVGNAITETWSNGQTEGQINRLKTLKRAM